MRKNKSSKKKRGGKTEKEKQKQTCFKFKMVAKIKRLSSQVESKSPITRPKQKGEASKKERKMTEEVKIKEKLRGRSRI